MEWSYLAMNKKKQQHMFIKPEDKNEVSSVITYIVIKTPIGLSDCNDTMMVLSKNVRGKVPSKVAKC